MQVVKKVLSVAFTTVHKAEQICEQVFERYIAPGLSHLAKDDAHVRRLARLGYRFVPFFARVLVSKERFETFVLNRVRFFVKAEAISPEEAAATVHA